MKLHRLLAGLSLGFALLARALAQDAAPVPAKTDLDAVDAQITAKMKAGKEAAEDYVPEFAALDALLVKYQGDKSEAVAEIAYSKAMLHWQVTGKDDVINASLAAVVDGFPGTKPAASAAKMLKGRLTVAALPGKPAPELHFKWTSRADGPKTLSALRGRVVVLDFWATWCGPCIRSFPQVREHVAHFKDAPVSFVGVTSIQGVVANLEPKRINTKGDPEKEMSLMPAFMQAKEMTWDVAFSEEPVFNEDYGISGIPFVAIIAPDGTVRFAGLHPGDPASDLAGKIEAILREFKLPVPARG